MKGYKMKIEHSIMNKGSDGKCHRIVYVFEVTSELKVILQSVQRQERNRPFNPWCDAASVDNYDIRNDEVYTHNPIRTISNPVKKFIKDRIIESIEFRLTQQVKG